LFILVNLEVIEQIQHRLFSTNLAYIYFSANFQQKRQKACKKVIILLFGKKVTGTLDNVKGVIRMVFFVCVSAKSIATKGIKIGQLFLFYEPLTTSAADTLSMAEDRVNSGRFLTSSLILILMLSINFSQPLASTLSNNIILLFSKMKNHSAEIKLDESKYFDGMVSKLL
jgi:hypothetical protein